MYKNLSLVWKLLLPIFFFAFFAVGISAYFYNEMYWLMVKSGVSGLMNFVDAKQQGVIRFLGQNEKFAKQLAVLVNNQTIEADIINSYFKSIVDIDGFKLKDHQFYTEIETDENGNINQYLDKASKTRKIATWKVYYAIEYVNALGQIEMSSISQRIGKTFRNKPDLKHGYSDVYKIDGVRVISFGQKARDGMVYVHAKADMLTTYH